MPFTGTTFAHIFDWFLDPQRQEKIKNARLEAEFDDIDAGLTALAWGGTTAGQIAFPATQNPSANANTLDDYEEGSWTPVLTFATPGNVSVTYSVQAGRYTKIGNVVTLWFSITTSSFTHTTASGNAQITGLPFTASGAISARVAISWAGITKTNYTSVAASVGAASATITLIASGSGQAQSNVTATDMPTAGTVFLSGSI